MTGGDWGYADRFRESTSEILEKSRQLEASVLANGESNIDPNLYSYLLRHFEYAEKLIRIRHQELKKEGVTDLLTNSRNMLLDFSASLNPNLKIVDSRSATVTAFPTGTVLMGRQLADSFTQYGDANRLDPLLTAIFVHELSHILDGHSVEQWAAANHRAAFISATILNATSNVTQLIAPGLFNFRRVVPLSYTGTTYLPELSEYAADLAVSSILDKEGIPLTPYIEYLAIASTSQKDSSKKHELEGRVDCLRMNLQQAFAPSAPSVHSGSHSKGDPIVAMWSIQGAYRLIDFLNSPQSIDEPAGIWPRALGTIRRSFQFSCAAAKVFPSAERVNEIIVIPSLDLHILQKYVGWPE